MIYTSSIKLVITCIIISTLAASCASSGKSQKAHKAGELTRLHLDLRELKS